MDTAPKNIIMKVIIVWSFFCFSIETDAARILGVFTVTGKSHFTCNHAIMKSLHDVGHNITMITPFPSDEKTANFTYVNSRFDDSFMLVGNSTINDFTEMSIGDLTEFLFNEELKRCHNIMNLKEIQEALNSPEKLYDVMFVEILSGHECYLPIAEKLGIPVIATVTFHFSRSADILVGVPFSPALIPLWMHTSGVEMTFFERMRNLLDTLVVEYYGQIILPKKLERFYREHFGKEEIRPKDISLIFYNNHPAFLSRAMTPNAIEVGGIHLQSPNPLSEILQKFIDEASHGVVLFTLETVVRGNSLPSRQREAFLAAFSKIPQRVMWKYEDQIENLPKNIMLSSWLPQRDILEHKKVIAFISHCGQSGTYEAIVTGTPIVAIPLVGDQLVNAANLVRQEVAVRLELETMTEEKVLYALNTIINDTGYFERMQAFSRAFQDRPMSPQKSVVYWTEYVIRHNGTQYFKTLGTNMPLYKYLMIDVLAVVIILTFLITYVIYKTVRHVYILFRSPPVSTFSERKVK